MTPVASGDGPWVDTSQPSSLEDLVALEQQLIPLRTEFSPLDLVRPTGHVMLFAFFPDSSVSAELNYSTLKTAQRYFDKTRQEGEFQGTTRAQAVGMLLVGSREAMLASPPSSQAGYLLITAFGGMAGHGPLRKSFRELARVSMFITPLSERRFDLRFFVTDRTGRTWSPAEMKSLEDHP